MTSLELFDYFLPDELIAQYPSQVRDASRLLVVNRTDKTLADRQFTDLCEYLHSGDVLVMNDSRVIHARLFGEKLGTGARVELFLLKDMSALHGQADTWEALLRPARRLKPGDLVRFDENLIARILEKGSDGSAVVLLQYSGDLLEALNQAGRIPLPPYIKREPEALDTERYQTVYAKEPGSAAAPTAGLHFTDDLLAKLEKQGVIMEFVTLHVGLGTFRPVQAENIEDHQMHEEFYHISPAVAQSINQAKAEGRRVVCVGTTSVRTLESAVCDGCNSIQAGWGSTRLFIYPGSQTFKITDALITNFHLPKSSLLMLVSAFYDREGILEAYQHAIKQRYRFFSYGDAMMIV